MTWYLLYPQICVQNLILVSSCGTHWPFLQAYQPHYRLCRPNLSDAAYHTTSPPGDYIVFAI